jgi:HEAT repeat protein
LHGVDTVDRLLGRFGTPGADQIRLILDAEDLLPDPRVHAFLIGLAADPAGYDLARIECMKILRLTPPAHPSVWRSAGRAVAAALAEDDELVRQFAATALGPYARDEVVFAALASAALHDENVDVRYNALDALEEAGPSDRGADLLRRLTDDPEVGNAAARVLSAWNHGLSR